MTDHNQLRRRLVDRLSSDEWMQRHFGIVAHADDVVDALLPIFADEVAQVAAEIAEALDAAANRCGQTYNAAAIARRYAPEPTGTPEGVPNG